ncbi:hypothetical protein FOZG_05542 [Fusarium oxysporum Fo47]|uniref:Uncharacterized protein n=1 Tax=Fusarium oxysporum Fo47 TaxID=660027 RepID=W9KSM5_FUSOX|nr:hypothetical protein FOZG_05542 [Fusarium oxysporum Fo47]EWZ45015.1 hypothetical protein FOZG_05542 [Fusarium oxysporum Fo47]
MMSFDSDLFSRSCLQRTARKKKKRELTQLIPPTHLCSTKAIGQSTFSDSDWSPLHDLRVLFGSSSGFLLSVLVICLYLDIHLSSFHIISTPADHRFLPSRTLPDSTSRQKKSLLLNNPA